MTRVVVTGASGFNGRETIAPLLTPITPSHLLHLARYVVPGRFRNPPENLDWVAASLRLVRGFAAAGGTRVVVASTGAEYDWSHAWLDERTKPVAPATLYGQAEVEQGQPRLGDREQPDQRIGLDAEVADVDRDQRQRESRGEDLPDVIGRDIAFYRHDEAPPTATGSLCLAAFNTGATSHRRPPRSMVAHQAVGYQHRELQRPGNNGPLGG